MNRIKTAARKIFFRIRIAFRKNFRKIMPRFHGRIGAPLLGGLIGFLGGIPGFFIGLLLGYLLGEILSQSRKDKKISNYFENPGAQRFSEEEPGLAAFCALGVIVASENQNAEKPADFQERVLKQVVLEACHVFTGARAEPSLMEHFTRIAWSRKNTLNPDLLAESLASRQAKTGGVRESGLALFRLAEGESAKVLARGIRVILDPASADEREPDISIREIQNDPWKILGLPPGTSAREVKAHYRRLAKQFHPDELQVLDEKQREAAARAFIAIKNAYKQIAEAGIP